MKGRNVRKTPPLQMYVNCKIYLCQVGTEKDFIYYKILTLKKKSEGTFL